MAAEIRPVPTASKGFMAATMRKPGSAGMMPTRGTCTSRSAMTVTSTLRVSSGTRLISSTYRSDPAAQGGQERSVDEGVGAVPAFEHLGGIVRSEQPGRCELGVALDEHELGPDHRSHAAQERRLAGARRPFEQHVAPGGEGGKHQLGLASATDHRGFDRCQRRRCEVHRGDHRGWPPPTANGELGLAVVSVEPQRVDPTEDLMTDADHTEPEIPAPGAHDPTEPLDGTTPLPSPEPTAAPEEPAPDPDRVDQTEVLRFMARRLLIWGVPLVLIGVLLVALGLPVWIIVVALMAALAIVVFELDL